MHFTTLQVHKQHTVTTRSFWLITLVGASSSLILLPIRVFSPVRQTITSTSSSLSSGFHTCDSFTVKQGQDAILYDATAVLCSVLWGNCTKFLFVEHVAWHRSLLKELVFGPQVQLVIQTL